MKGRRAAWVATVLVVLLAGFFAVRLFLPGGGLGAAEKPAPQLEGAAAFEAALDTISDSFYEEVDGDVLIEAANRGIRRMVDAGETDETELTERAITAMIDSLDDPFSEYMNASELAQLETQLSGHFGGVGISLTSVRNEIRVNKVLEGTPAEAAGIDDGDVLAEVDGESTANMDINDVVTRVRGPEGTHVRLGVRRANSSELLYFDIVRGTIDLQVIETSMVQPDIGLIRLADWTENISDKVAQALSDLQRQGARGIIVDLRSNPGGYFEEARQVADFFLRSGTIVSSQGRNGSNNRTYEADAEILSDLPLVILIDRLSASASEIFAGAIQDNSRGVLVGQTSFGKGSIQKIFVQEGGGLRLTIAKYLTPSGVNIDDEGIEPDELVSNPVVGEEDLQEARALEVMREMIDRGRTAS
ncbi:MAG: S41 family peptidase [Candidatus Geothermincolia bacterium]